LLIASFARHIAHTSPDPRDPRNAVQAVRVYRVTHKNISPRELSEGIDPLDAWNFFPVYMGKYDPEGQLLDAKDPFLYWSVPIIRVPKRYPEVGTYISTPDGPMLNPNYVPTPEEPGKVIDFVEIHATQSDKFQKETEEK
jgi:hypothetical protein